ncbi:glycosyltransferase family 39 protein [Cryobacterium psychrophilum]|uniref:Glycosyltransferase RgtA/B/C/D-like domain-containing protein n=1 Tax=Cryobacterium psychrophilum TaxID=41988 RepID=A0A4Y8KN76_9MICO|nr:hypothetical protein [Cryobacterium psychrophilum]TDW30728.1 mannosyltransferase [Cryobacterium psychrophilum]TFD76593.1 hypothetical protein E3T53_13095 [Cryobacterium psychrophilum]
MTASLETARTLRALTARRFRGARMRDAAVVGAIALILSMSFSWVPSIWFDEAATITSATRSWPELLRMLSSVDLVHGVYYAAMHVWFDLVPYSPFTLRLPSAIFTGLAAALTVWLAGSFTSRRTAILAGLAFSVLPRVTWAGEEGRSFALGTTFAVLLTLVFLAAWRRGAAPRAVRARWWALYWALAVVSTGVFLYLALLVVAHGATAVWTGLAQRRSDGTTPLRRTTRVGLLGWFGASVGAGALLLPFALAVSSQSKQVSWIPPIGSQTLIDVVVWQWFALNPAFAVAGWSLVIAGVALLVRAARRTRARARPVSSTPSLLAIAVPWIVVPTVGLIVASLLASPLYSPRYLTFGAPAVALLMGVALGALRRTWLHVLALAVLVALAAPQYVAQRLPEAKQESSWSEVATLVATSRGTHPATGAIIYGPVRHHPAATTRLIALSYPDAFKGLVDVNLKTAGAEAGTLWADQYSLAQVTDRFDGKDEVWLVTSDKQDWRPSVTAKLAALGLHVDQEWHLTGVNVLRYVR